MPPSLPSAPQILPRQPGETAYAYRKRRTVALTGETPYQRRIRNAQARGLSTTEARGHKAGESATRRERTLARTGLTPWQLWSYDQIAWLMDNGFTPETTGWSWNQLIRIAPRLRYMNNHASPGAQVTPDMIAEALTFERTSNLPSEWTWERVNEKYLDIYEFYERGDVQPARMHYFQDRIPQMDVAWWYYH
jgi:hypothetical protein